MDRKKLRDELIRDEGRVLTSYQDSSEERLWTVGIGHLLGPTRRVITITDAECEAWFDHDAGAAEIVARSLAPGFDLLSDARQRALVNMAFNLGGRLAGFKRFLTALNAQNWQQAALEMADSKWAKQVGARAERIQAMILAG